QRRRDGRAAVAARPLRLDHVAMVPQTTEIDGNRAVLHVETIYGFSGVRSLFIKHSKVTAKKTPQGWRGTPQPGRRRRAPWDLGRSPVRRSRHFVALSPHGLHVGSLMSDLEHGRTEQHHGLLFARPPGRMLVLVTRGGADARALTRDVRALGSLTAMAEA